MKILYLNKSYFAYDRAIYKQLVIDGYEVVDCQYVKNEPNYFTRQIYSRKKIDFGTVDFLKFIENKVYRAEEPETIDIVLVAFLEMKEETIVELKKLFKNAMFVKCIFDDVTWYSENDFAVIKKYFDKVISYYESDAKQYGMAYNPNFYVDETENEKIYDWSFIGTAPKKRELVLSKLLKGNSFNSYVYIYKGNMGIKDRIKESVLGKGVEPNIKPCIRYSPLSYEKMNEIFSKSKCILDIQHTWQKGLSMRPFHAMSMHTKLITTNENIKNYDFYRPNNIWIIDYENPVLPDYDFINSEYEELEEAIYQKYSIKSWCERLEKEFSKISK